LQRERAQQQQELQQARSGENAAERVSRLADTPSAEPSIVVNRQSVERPFAAERVQSQTVRNEDRLSAQSRNALNSYQATASLGAVSPGTAKQGELVGVDVFI
jgi:hypothetical protein